MSFPKAILLLGHSNAGKTPLGDLMERSLTDGGRAYRHLDFGEHLRRIAAGRWNPGLTPSQVDRIRTVMDGRLLETADFPIAETIVRGFTTERKMVAAQDVLVLNGLPRNTGQARGLEKMGVGVSLVVFLDCSPETAWRRKTQSEEGKGFEKRSHRGDSAREIFDRKVRSFAEDTLRVLEDYRERGARIVRVPVDAKTPPEEMLRAIQGAFSTLPTKEL